LTKDIIDDISKNEVTFLSINQGESKKQIRSFLEERDISCAVGVDKNCSVGKKYKAEGAPLIVVIGPEGKVRLVRWGFIQGGITTSLYKIRMKAKIRAYAYKLSSDQNN